MTAKLSIPFERSLAFLSPHVAAQWHPTKNGDLSARATSNSANVVVWWQCEQGHEWEASVKNRTKSNKPTGCPYCSGRFPVAGVNDLQTLRPEVAAQWHPTKNVIPVEKSTITSGAKRWWLCEQGHEWEATVASRTSNNSGCPYCSGRKVIPGQTDLRTTHPQIAQQWHPAKNGERTPSEVSAGSDFMAWWICDMHPDYIWQSTVDSRVQALYPCSKCGTEAAAAIRRAPSPGRSLAVASPQLAVQWVPELNDNRLASEISVGSGYLATWVCDQGHKWQSPVQARAIRGDGCPYCSGRYAIPGETDFQHAIPDLAAQWHPTKNGECSPSQVTPGSSRKVWWQCQRGHEWQATVKHRAAGTGCPYCSGRYVIPGETDIATLYPRLVEEWHPKKNLPLTPEQVSRGTNAKIWWKCQKDHEWHTLISDRVVGKGCPECAAASYVSRGEKDVLDVLNMLLSEPVIRTSDRSALRGLPRNDYGNGELDLYLPEYKLAIEFNGVYWHSEIYKSRDYHAKKQQACASRGIALYQIWEDDWEARREIVIRGLAHRLGVTVRVPNVLPDIPTYYTQTIGARKCRLTQVDSETAQEFLHTHHIQGFVRGSKYFGLLDREGRLRAVLAMRRARTNGSSTAYIDRYATAGTVQGGFSKLLKAAVKQMGLAQVVTFSDCSISDGRLYQDNGFEADGVLPPDYAYLVQNKRVHKFNYRLKRFREDENLQYQEGLSERELAQLNDIPRVWDSGKVRWVWQKPEES